METLLPYYKGFTLSTTISRRQRYTVHLYLSDKYTIMIHRTLMGANDVYVFRGQVMTLDSDFREKYKLHSFVQAKEKAMEMMDKYSMKSLL